jgi:hypothetical protein
MRSGRTVPARESGERLAPLALSVTTGQRLANLSDSLSVCVRVFLSVSQSQFLRVSFSVCLSVCLSVSDCLAVWLPLPACLLVSVCLFVCLSAFLSVLVFALESPSHLFLSYYVSQDVANLKAELLKAWCAV